MLLLGLWAREVDEEANEDVAREGSAKSLVADLEMGLGFSGDDGEDEG